MTRATVTKGSGNVFRDLGWIHSLYRRGNGGNERLKPSRLPPIIFLTNDCAKIVLKGITKHRIAEKQLTA